MKRADQGAALASAGSTDSPGSAESTGSTATAGLIASLERISSAVRDARTYPDPGASPSSGGRDVRLDQARGSTEFLTALALLRELRTQIAGWEPDLIDAARSHGASWAQLAPALGVASRQAAERRYLRLRPATDAAASTGDQRVRAERDKRAADRAVRLWARQNAADLRQLAGQISALSDLPPAANTPVAGLRQALGENDAADLLGPLADTHDHVAAGYPALAARIRDVARDTDSVRHDTRARRRTSGD